MAIVKNPFMSIAAAGSIGGVMSAKQTDQGQIMGKMPSRMSPASAWQETNRQRMRDASAAYIALSDADRLLWYYLGEKRHRPAWVVFFGEYQNQNIQAPAAPLIPSTWV